MPVDRDIGGLILDVRFTPATTLPRVGLSFDLFGDEDVDLG